MKYSKLGKTEISISYVVLGTWGFAGDRTWGIQNDQESCDTVHAALNEGINFFDTAEMYGNGHSEEVLGKALKGCRSEAVIASKVASKNLSKNDLIQACENSLSRLQTDYIDLYLIHWMNKEIPIEETMEAMEYLKMQGKIRAIGLCNTGVKDLEIVTSISDIVCNQLPYSLLWRPIEYQLKQKCIEKNIGIHCYSSLSQGLLTGKYLKIDEVPEGRMYTRLYSGKRPNARHGEVGHEEEIFKTLNSINEYCKEISLSMTQASFGWLRQQEGITGILTGARKPQDIKENVENIEKEIPDEVIEKLSLITQPLKESMGTNVDMWQSQSRIV